MLGSATKIRNGASKTTSEIDDENQIKKQFISSHAFHRTSGGHVQKIIVKKRFEPRILKLFDPATQKYDRKKFLQPQSTHTMSAEIIERVMNLEENQCCSEAGGGK
jgi:hypothetical protein